MDNVKHRLEVLEQQLTLLIDLSQNLDTVQTTGTALAYTYENLREQIQAIKNELA